MRSVLTMPTTRLTCLAWCLSLLVAFVEAQTVTLNFTITIPNSTWPSLGELWTGSLTYSTTPNSVVAWPGYPLGYPLTKVTGTRSVWVASASAPTVYTSNGTATILGLVPAYNNQYYYNNQSIPLAPGVNRLQVVSSLSADSHYGSIAVNAVFNLTNYTTPDGFQLFPITEFLYDNLFYSPATVYDGMDTSGWLFQLDRPQWGALNVSYTSMYAGRSFTQYQYACNIYSNDGQPTSTDDLSDFSDNVDSSIYPLIYGFNGHIAFSQPAVSGVRGDPQFVGLLGQSFQVHGMDGAVYNLISEEVAQVNARFAFLDGPRACPTVHHSWDEETDSTADSIQCWSHAGSYLSELGVFTTHSRLFIQAGTAEDGFRRVEMNGMQVVVQVSSGVVSVQVHTTHHLTVSVGSFILHVDNSDGFVNIAGVRLNVAMSALKSHGLLGQTWHRPESRSKVSAIEGDVDDYSILDGNLFGSDFLFNKLVVTA